jgi:hypothetical protein
MIDVGTMVEYESGELTEEETIEFFQELVDTGLAWQLQGSYGRTAMDLLRDGYLETPSEVVFPE